MFYVSRSPLETVCYIKHLPPATLVKTNQSNPRPFQYDRHLDLCHQPNIVHTKTVKNFIKKKDKKLNFNIMETGYVLIKEIKNIKYKTGMIKFPASSNDVCKLSTNMNFPCEFSGEFVASIGIR